MYYLLLGMQWKCAHRNIIVLCRFAQTILHSNVTTIQYCCNVPIQIPECGGGNRRFREADEFLRWPVRTKRSEFQCQFYSSFVVACYIPFTVLGLVKLQRRAYHARRNRIEERDYLQTTFSTSWPYVSLKT